MIAAAIAMRAAPRSPSEKRNEGCTAVGSGNLPPERKVSPYRCGNPRSLQISAQFKMARNVNEGVSERRWQTRWLMPAVGSALLASEVGTMHVVRWFVFLVIVGCGHVPLSTMYRMRHLDAATIDPAVVRAAIRIPGALAPAPNGVKLILRTWHEGDNASGREAEFLLEETTSASERAPLEPRAQAGTRIHVFRVALADVPRMRAIQAETIQARRSARSDMRGSVTVSADRCRLDAVPNAPLRITTYLRTDAREDFFVLVEDVDIREMIPKDKPFDAVVPVCPVR